MPEIKKIVFDSVSICNFLLTGSTALLKKAYKKRMIIPWQVYDEVCAGYSSFPALQLLDTLVEKKIVVVTSLNASEHALYVSFLGSLGKGEAAGIAICANRHFILVSDDKAARMHAKSLDIKITGTIGILKRFCETKILLPEQADTPLAEMIQLGFYSPVKKISDIL